MARRKKGVARRMLIAAVHAGLEPDQPGSTIPEMRLWVGGARNQQLRDHVELELRSGLRCDVVVTGEVIVPRKLRETRTVGLKPLTTELQPMRRITVHVELPPVAQRMSARALKRGAAVMAVLVVNGTDGRGHPARIERQILLSLSPPPTEELTG